MKKFLAEQVALYPLRSLLILSFFIRLIAAFFAKGWGMMDDHFLVIETSWSWSEGFDVNKWLPWTPGNKGPEGHSFLYVGFHYGFMEIFRFLHIKDPQWIMFFIRLIHAGFSLIVVYFGYKFAERFSGKKDAFLVGSLLALYWFMPWASVRNLVEVVAIPLLISGLWLLYNSTSKKNISVAVLLAGILMGLAFSVRYQTSVFTAGVGIFLLYNKQWKSTLLFSAGVLISVLAIQGGIDMLIWGRPFAEMEEYVQYNLDHRYNFFTGDWYNYLLLLGGILLPPVSLFLLTGFFRSWKKHLIIFLPTALFLAFHMYFPNRQERFILTIIPFVIITGVTGWNDFIYQSDWWIKRLKLLKNIWVFFWILNSILLIPFSLMYGKKSRAEAMYHLYQYKEIKTIIAENSVSDKVDLLPQFYAGQRIAINEISSVHPLGEDTSGMNSDIGIPRFVLFYSDKKLEKRIKEMKVFYPELTFEKRIKPGFVDQLMTWLNPRNNNQDIYIYRNTRYFPVSKSN